MKEVGTQVDGSIFVVSTLGGVALPCPNQSAGDCFSWLHIGKAEFDRQLSEGEEEIPAMHARSSPNATHQGQLTRSHAKKLQQEIHSLLCEIHFNINENYILPKCCMLIYSGI
jgi:hypothetical protein